MKKQCDFYSALQIDSPCAEAMLQGTRVCARRMLQACGLKGRAVNGYARFAV
jgi:hypothetical protein